MDLTAIVLSLPAMILGGIITALVQLSIGGLRKMIAQFFANVPSYVSQAIKDPQISRVVLAAMVQAQKEFGSEQGKEKFRYVKTQVLRACPDMWDGAVDCLIQTLYEEFVKAPMLT